MAFAVDADAQPAPGRAQAAEHFDRGTALLKSGDFGAALGEFEAAYQITRSWKVLVHIGTAQARLVRYTQALKTLARYLEQGGDKIPAERREAVQRELKAIRTMLARVSVVVQGGPAQVSVDDRAVGRSPLAEPLLLDPGKHTLQATRPGYAPATARVELPAGGTRRVVLTLNRLTGLLRVDSRPAGARLSIDGRPVGKTPWDGRLEVAAHQIEARIEGHKPGVVRVHVDARQSRQITIELLALPPPPPPPWYKRWYVWTGVGAVVVAAVVTGTVLAVMPSYDGEFRVPNR